MGEKPLQIELRIALDARDVFENRLLSGLAIDELVVGAGLYAMRRGQQQVARDRRRGTGRTIGTEDHNHGTPDAVGRRRSATDHRQSGSRAW